MGLHKEGILAEPEVSAFRLHLLETLITSPLDLEQPCILRDKLLFLQELLYSKCISEEEYHSSKRPLLQRLAVQGAEIETGDVIIAAAKDLKLKGEDEWCISDRKDENCLLNKEDLQSKRKLKHGSTMKQIEGAAPVTPHKPGKQEKTICDWASNSNRQMDSYENDEFTNFRQNPFWDTNLKEIKSNNPSIVTLENIPAPHVKESGGKDKGKRKPFRTLFQREEDGDGNTNNDPNSEVQKSKKQWDFYGFKKCKRNGSEDETSPLPINESSGTEACQGYLVADPVKEGPDTRHPSGSSSYFFADKVIGDKVKKELARAQNELCTKNSNHTFKNHVGEMENSKNVARYKHSNLMKWTTFEDDENCHPNLFTDNPLLQDSIKLNSESAFYQNQNQNPFWSP